MKRRSKPKDDHLINEMSESDRPRERMVKMGRSVMTDSELIAILLGSGMRSRSVLTLARELLMQAGSLRELARWSLEDFQSIPGIGEAKAIRLQSAFELGRRFPLEAVRELPIIRHSSDAYDQFVPVLADIRHEEFWVIYVSNANRILSKEKLSQGGITATVTDLRILFRKALSLHATGVILAHNHPSGNLKPSVADHSLTQRAIEAGKFLDIHVIDHLILSPNDYVSFADEGWLNSR